MSLADRARAAAGAAAASPAMAGSIRDQDWHRALRMKLPASLACLLGLDPAEVTVRDDPVRRWGPWAWPLLEFTDPDDGRRYTFTCKPVSDTVLARGSCTACGGTVPVARIAHLADLCDLLTGRASRQLPAEFYGDPGHDPGCRHHSA